MTVIAEFRVASDDFELGRILTVEAASAIELESLIPTGGVTVPLFWAYNSMQESFVEAVHGHPAVNDTAVVEVFEGRTLFTLDWDANRDLVFRGIDEHDGQLLSAVGHPDVWDLELRFPSHAALNEFTTHCEEAGIPLAMTRIYNPTEADVGPLYGLTDPQREAIRLAVRRGYYDIPRECSTQELADELGVSDQAVMERLRRAIVAIVKDTLPADELGA
ncbi:MAG: hypothetical protein ACI9EZ_001669 [Halobacteriales archaeon]